MGRNETASFGSLFNNVKLHGVVGGMEDNSVRRRWRRDARHGGFFYQEFKFKFPKGKEVL